MKVELSAMQRSEVNIFVCDTIPFNTSNINIYFFFHKIKLNLNY